MSRNERVEGEDGRRVNGRVRWERRKEHLWAASQTPNLEVAWEFSASALLTVGRDVSLLGEAVLFIAICSAVCLAPIQLMPVAHLSQAVTNC